MWEACQTFYWWWWIVGGALGFVVGYNVASLVWKREVTAGEKTRDAVLSEFRRATNKPTLTLEELLNDLKTLKAPLPR